jgi:hypothetical protein
MPAIFQTLKVFAHLSRLPGRITGEPSDIAPIIVVRIDEDQRIMGCTAAQRPRPRIKNTVSVGGELRVPLLSVVSGIMPHEEIPPDRFVLRGKGMKGGNLVVFG